MPEIKREEILAERSEQKSALQEKRLLAQMVRQQKSAGMGAALDEDSVARAAKRKWSFFCLPPWHGFADRTCLRRPTHGAGSDEGKVEEAR